MPKMLTDITIRKLKPRALRYEVGDAGARCLRVVVQPSGFKSYVVRFTNAAGRRRKLTLPNGITLVTARKLAADALLEVAQGRDPSVTKREAKRTAQGRMGDTVEWLANQFIEQHAKRKNRRNTWRATIGTFNNHVLPSWGSRSVHDITRRDAIELLEQIAIERPITANRVKAVLSKFFGWLCERDVIAASPCVGVKPPSAEVARDRVLTDDELRRLWLAGEAIGGTVGAYVKLLILTGQRRGEIANLKWTEVGGDVLELSAERMKGKRPHLVPLSTQAASVIASMPKLMPQVPRPDDHVLGRKLGWHFHHVKQALDERMGDTPKWVIHDIRRSVASGMAKIGIAVPVIEKILAHKSGTFRGIVGTYQRHSFLPEMAVALQRWADHVDQLVGGKPAEVVKLRRRDA
jgi:integrase